MLRVINLKELLGKGIKKELVTLDDLSILDSLHGNSREITDDARFKGTANMV